MSICVYCDADTRSSLDVCAGCRDCISCGESCPRGECSKSQAPCGHHCNHSWTHDECDWCGQEFGEEPVPEVAATTRIQEAPDA